MSPQRISIVLPTYNGARFLAGAIANCLEQTNVEIELIVVDDASTDSTPSILSALHDDRLIKPRHKSNAGLPSALNTGFQMATGEYLTWTSDDNLYAPNALQILSGYLDTNPDIDFVYSAYWTIDQHGKVLGLRPVDPPEDLKHHNTVGACFLYRRKVHDQIGAYNPKLRLIEDYEYWVRVSRSFRMAALNVPLYYYRLHDSSLTSKRGTAHKVRRLILQMKRKYYGLSWRSYCSEISGINIDEAFACYREGYYRSVPGLVLIGVARNPRHAANFGVWSIFARSLVGRYLKHKEP